MKCLYITQEHAPHFAEGGLGLTSNALPATLQSRRGVTHDLVLPYYPWLVQRQGLDTEVVLTLPEREVGGIRSDAEIHRVLGYDGVCEIYLLRADAWYDRGGIYRDANYAAFSDETRRAAFFGSCVAEWLQVTEHDYDLIHGNDWQSGAAMSHLRDRFPTLTQVLTIHNAFYQGRLRPLEPIGLGLPEAQVARLEEHAQGSPSLFLLGLLAADAAVTCSPTYAYELVKEFRGTPIGDALERLDITGIVFGVDDVLWDPAAVGRVTHPYDAGNVDQGKRLNKQALQKHLELTEDDTLPVIGVCSRVVPEKGSDLLLEALAPLLREQHVQLVLVGPSTDELHSRLCELRAAAPGMVGYLPQFAQDVAWLVYAGADLTVMPSRIEPCGLNQLIAYGYGTLPVASPVGGLRDTVTDVRTHPNGGGFVIPEHTVESVRSTVLAAVDWMREGPDELTAVRRRVMAQDWSWAVTAREYTELYTRLTTATT
ncbi:glycogen synthase [Streptomyces sp. YGL11-2]|uniref:glycogen synthase n=1 Tax=Streptomyces sp. YGL11-2 TaxID=3414028 RepID=UPI003CEE55ED